MIVDSCADIDFSDETTRNRWNMS